MAQIDPTLPVYRNGYGEIAIAAQVIDNIPTLVIYSHSAKPLAYLPFYSEEAVDIWMDKLTALKESFQGSRIICDINDIEK